MEDLKIKQTNYAGSVIFFILIILLGLHAKKTSNPMVTFSLTAGIAIYVYVKICIYISKNETVSHSMFLADIIFNVIIISIIILLLSPLKHTGSMPVDDVGSDKIYCKDNFSLPEALPESNNCAGSRQLFEVSPIKKCCGGSYMRTSNPELDDFCNQFSPEELINKCVARKNEYVVPSPDENTTDENKQCSTCHLKNKSFLVDVIGVS